MIFLPGDPNVEDSEVMPASAAVRDDDDEVLPRDPAVEVDEEHEVLPGDAAVEDDDGDEVLPGDAAVEDDDDEVLPRHGAAMVGSRPNTGKP